MPEISIIVPVYKVEAYIHRCVDSILEQTFRDFELILVDDGSPDHCGVICDEYACRDNRVHVVHTPNGGAANARNIGLDWVFSNSNSQWISFVDSDDWVHPAFLEKMIELVRMYDTDIVVCNYLDTTGEVVADEEVEWGIAQRTVEEFYLSNNMLFTVPWGKLYRRNCFEGIRYPTDKYAEDEFTTYKILFKKPTIFVISNPLYYYFFNPNGLSKAKWMVKHLDALEALKEQSNYFKEYGFEKAYQWISVWYATSIIQQSKNVEQSELPQTEKNKYIRYLRRCLRKAVWDYGEIYLKQDHSFYLEAYPILKPIYQELKAIKKKLRKK